MLGEVGGRFPLNTEKIDKIKEIIHVIIFSRPPQPSRNISGATTEELLAPIYITIDKSQSIVVTNQ